MPAEAPAITPPDTANAAPPSPRFDCVLRAWHAHEGELLNFLAHQLHDRALAEDLLQEVFLKSMRAGQGFCTLDNPRAWLYRVAKTTLVDHARSSKPFVELPDNLVAPSDERPAVDELDGCLLRNLAHLSDDDRAIVQACDLQGQTVRDFAQANALGLPAAKSRLLRARQRLRQHLVANCQVQFDASGQVCCHSASNIP
ncbi:sigma-70 family RNA polymerase sigma factor [Rhodoferax sp. 4810]|nr:sigma-70 family RNA polymerase sigma factor [Rhodoferax jenense]